MKMMRISGTDGLSYSGPKPYLRPHGIARDRDAGVEQAMPLVAEAHSGFPRSHLIVEEAPHEIAVDREAAGAEPLLIARIEPDIVQRCREQREGRQQIGFVA